MTIAIIGKGTSAIVTAMTCLDYGFDVEIYSDPDSPHLNVGESTTPHLAKLILSVFDIPIGELLDKDIVSFKNGIKFINWGVGKDFRHHFQSNLSAFHFESGIFNPFIHNLLKSSGVVYHEKKVENYSIIDDKVYLNDRYYDFIISCVGWDDSQEYYRPVFETVNTGILYKEEEVDDPSYTLHRATKHGWQFGLPFPYSNVTKCGYLFNSSIDDPKTVYEELGKEDAQVIEWKPRYSKKLLQDKYHGFNGNRLFFLEPLQALSVYYYIEFAKEICEYLNNVKYETFERANKNYLERMFEYQMSLAWHYSYGSIFDSEYWTNVKQNANQFLNLNHNYSHETLLRQYIHDSRYQSRDFLHIGPFSYIDFRAIHGGMNGVDIKDLICEEKYFF